MPFFRMLTAPELTWKRYDKDFSMMVNTLAMVMAVPLYHTSKTERDKMGKFYASDPSRATYLFWRIHNESFLRLTDAKKSLEKSLRLTSAVMDRLFSTSARQEIMSAEEYLKEAKPDEWKAVSQSAALLALAAQKSSTYARELPDYEQAIARGKLLIEIDPELVNASDEYLAYLGKHFLVFADPMFHDFSAWLFADSVNKFKRDLFRGAGAKEE